MARHGQSDNEDSEKFSDDGQGKRGEMTTLSSLP
jgi:hypothetical protein